MTHPPFFARVGMAFIVVASTCAKVRGQQILVQRVPPPASAGAMWKHDLGCSGAKPAGDLRGIIWLVGVWQPNEDGSVTLGQWLPPDTIALLPVTYLSPVIVAHELLHHLLQGPTSEEHHPQAFFDCDLMPEQHPVDSASQLVDLKPRRRPDYRTQERVIDRDGCVDIFHCAAFEPYRRPGDSQFGPVWWLISQEHRGCVVSGADFVSALNGQFFPCVWRSPR